jgi:type IX secretion system PorP/SprF family membrane protein
VHSQDKPKLSLSQQETSFFNPAFTGLEKLHRFQFHHRRQWMGFDGGPSTQILSYSGSYFRSVGLGGYFYLDAVGPVKNYGANVAYAFHIDMAKTSFAFGLSMSLAQTMYDFKEMEFENMSDPLIAGTDVVKSKIRPDFTGGAIWYGQKHILGLSVNYRFKNEVKENIDISLEADQHYYLFGNYSFPLSGDKIVITPNALGFVNSELKYQWEAGVRSKFNNTALLGISYRNDKSVILSAGVKLLKMFEFNYAYDFSYGNIGEYYKSSHEILLICRIRKLTDAFKNREERKLKEYYWL